MPILCNPAEALRLPIPAPASLAVGEITYTNTAAKFWATLFHEVHWCFPQCDRVELRALCSGTLCSTVLDPAASLSREIERLKGQNVRELLYDTIAQLALDGPPPPVRVQVLANGTPALNRDIPPDCLDAELFPYFLCWLLQWAGITHHLWDAESLCGGFTATVPGANRRYALELDVHGRHVSEGLYEREVSVAYAVEPTS